MLRISNTSVKLAHNGSREPDLHDWFGSFPSKDVTRIGTTESPNAMQAS